MIGIKYYPQNATTNSNFVGNSIESVSHILKTMEEGIPLYSWREHTTKYRHF